MVGASARLLELVLDFAKTRIQFDMPIGIQQYVQEFCVEVACAAETSRKITYQAAWMLSEDMSCDMEVAMAKAWTSDAHERACFYTHSVYAGVGATLESTPPLYTRRALTQKLYLGDSSYHLEKVAKEVEKWPAPERPRGKPLGIWNIRDEEQIPAWEPWRQRWEAIQKKEEERRMKKAQKK